MFWLIYSNIVKKQGIRQKVNAFGVVKLVSHQYAMNIPCPHYLKTFRGTFKRNILCVQMISFEFLRAASIGCTVSRGKNFVHTTRPGTRDWPAACFLRPISHTMVFTTIRQVNK